VRIPLMPQGVEHAIVWASAPISRPVRIPLMPQGVEHFNMVAADAHDGG